MIAELDLQGMTFAEYYRVHGHLTISCIEELIDFRERVGDAPDIFCYLVEAKAGFPEEDFLNDPISNLQTLARNLRGDNRNALLSVVQSLEEIQMQSWQAAEHGLEQLRNAEAEMKKAENNG